MHARRSRQHQRSTTTVQEPVESSPAPCPSPSPRPAAEHAHSDRGASKASFGEQADWQAILFSEGKPLGRLVHPTLESSGQPEQRGLSLRFTSFLQAPTATAAAPTAAAAAQPAGPPAAQQPGAAAAGPPAAQQPGAAAARPQPLRLPVDDGFAQRALRVQVVGRRRGAPAITPPAYDVHGRDLAAGLRVQRQWQEYQQRHQAARASAGQPVSAANFAHSSTLTVESGDGLERLQAIFDVATAPAWLKGIVCRFLLPEAASQPDAGLPAPGSSAAAERSGAAAAVSMAAPAAVPGGAGPQPDGLLAAKQRRPEGEAPPKQVQEQRQRLPSQERQPQQRQQQPAAAGAAPRGAAPESAAAGSKEGGKGKRGRKKQPEAEALRSCSSNEPSPAPSVPRSAGSRASSAASTASAGSAQPQPSDLPANRGGKAHGGKARAGGKAQPAAQPSSQPATEEAALPDGTAQSGRQSRSRSSNRRDGQEASLARRMPKPAPPTAEQPAAQSSAGDAQQPSKPARGVPPPSGSSQAAGPAGSAGRGQPSRQAASGEAAQAAPAAPAMPAAGGVAPARSSQLREAEALAADLLGLEPAHAVCGCGYCSPAAAVWQGAAGAADMAAVLAWQGPAGSADLAELAAAEASGAGGSGKAEAARRPGLVAGTPVGTPAASPLRLRSPAACNAGGSSSGSPPGSPAGGSDGSGGSGGSYLSYCSSEGFRTPSRPSGYGLPYAFGPETHLPWQDPLGMGQQAAYPPAQKLLADAQRSGRRSTGSFAASRGYHAAPQALHPSGASMPALHARHRRTSSSSSGSSLGGGEAGGLAAYQSAPPRWQGSSLNSQAEPYSPRSQQQRLGSHQRAPSLPARPQRSYGSEPLGEPYWQQHRRSGSGGGGWHQPQLSADVLPTYALPQMAVCGGSGAALGSAGGWSGGGMPCSAPASAATSPILHRGGLPVPQPPDMPSSSAPPPPPLLSVPALDLQPSALAPPPRQVPESADDSPDLERFLQAATPQVAPPPSGAQELTLADLWRWYEGPSTVGCEVATIGGPRGPATAYYLPFLSALQLLAPAGEADEAAVAAAAAAASGGDGSAAGQPDAPPPQLLSYAGGLDEWPERMRPLVQWGESANMRDRLPLHACLAGLCGEAGEEHPLMATRLADLHPFSWFAVAWYPLYCVPEAPLTARFITFHTLASLWEAATKAAAEAQQEERARLEAAAAEAVRQRAAAEATAAAAAQQAAAAGQPAEEQGECTPVRRAPPRLPSRPSYKSMLEAGLPAEAAPPVGTPACAATPTAVCSFPGSPTCSDAGTRTTLGSCGSRTHSVDGGAAGSTGRAAARSRLALGSTADGLACAGSCGGGSSVQGASSLLLSASERGSCSAASSTPASPAASEAGDGGEREALPVAVAGLAWYATGRDENWTDCLVAAQLPADAAAPLPPPGTPLPGGARLLGAWRGVAVLARPYPVAKGGPLGWEIQQEEMALCAEALAAGGGLVALRPAPGGRWEELPGLPPAQLGVSCPDYEFFMSRSARYC